MYSREEVSRIRKEFWTTFGRYLSPVPSASGEKVNWINYHTLLKDVYFRMNAGSHSASIAVSIEHGDEGVRQLYFEQFLELKTMLHQALQESWIWSEQAEVDGRCVARIYKEMQGVSIFNKADWGELISFFKPRIVALDAFWEDARYSFDSLR